MVGVAWALGGIAAATPRPSRPACSFPSLDRPAVTPAAAGVRVRTLLGRQQVVHPPLARSPARARPSVQNSVKLNGTR
jgi:hypothetical protein